MNIQGVGIAQFIDTSTGKVIGEIQMQPFSDSSDVYVTSNTKRVPLTKTYSMRLENATFDTDALKKLITPTADPVFKIVGESKTLNRLRYLHKRTKNKRIKRKLQNKISKIDHPLFHGGILAKASDIAIDSFAKNVSFHKKK